MDLELPATPNELVNTLKGLYQLPGSISKNAVSALKSHLYLDFLFMPFAYGAIFILCMLVSSKMDYPFGIILFQVLAWIQLIPWLCDIIENVYILRKIKPEPAISSPATHTAYLIMEAFKWGIAFVSIIAASSMISYFWLTGDYAVSSFHYLLIVLTEIALFFIMGKIFIKSKKKAIKNSI